MTLHLYSQVELAEQIRPDLVIIGPEAPLVEGSADRLREAGFTVFGPSAAAPVLEGSKTWAKEIMAAASVPTAASVTVTEVEELEAGLDRVNPRGEVPYVVKADGLAAGKGDRKSTRLNSSHVAISYAVFCLKKTKNAHIIH